MSNTDSKQEAPERIWIQPQYFNRVMPDGIYHKEPGPRTVEYVRADIASRASVAAPEGDAHDPDCCAKYMRGESVPEGAHECGNVPWCRRCSVCVADVVAASFPASPVQPSERVVEYLPLSDLGLDDGRADLARKVLEAVETERTQAREMVNRSANAASHRLDECKARVAALNCAATKLHELFIREGINVE